MAKRLTYKAVLADRGPTAALVRGAIAPRDFDLDFVPFPSLPPAFRRMVRGLEFDICEMAISTYVCARALGVPIVALPVFPVRGFHEGAILVRRDGDIKAPKDLEGRKVGLERGYTVTTGVWARGILGAEYGVDLSTIDWIVSGDEHVAQYTLPPHVHPIEPGKTVAENLLCGELAAAIGIPRGPDIVPLIVREDQAAADYRINHLIAVRSEVLAERPALALELLDTFAAAKQAYLAALQAGAIEAPDANDRNNLRLLQGGIDPLPYGLASNRAVLEDLVGHAVEQRIIDKAMPVDTLFPPETRAWTG